MDRAAAGRRNVDPVAAVRVERLGAARVEAARQAFSVMAETFGEGHEELSDAYVGELLARADFWAIAAIDGDEVVGGLTAHTLPMTRAEAAELFIYDLAVRPDRQRQGIGRMLVAHLVAEAAGAGIGVVFVPADDGDEHALDFYRSIGGRPSPVTIFDLG